MTDRLKGRRVAILVANGFEQVELTTPRQALRDAGAQVAIVSPEEDVVRGWDHTEWGEELPVDVHLPDADPGDYHALLLPGGVMNPDDLRRNREALRFVRSFFEDGKPVACICHGAWTLIDAEVVEGRRMTSYHTIQTDLKNAGARWVDEEVVVDRGLVTSRRPDDLPVFIRATIEAFVSGRREEQGLSVEPASAAPEV